MADAALQDDPFANGANPFMDETGTRPITIYSNSSKGTPVLVDQAADPFSNDNNPFLDAAGKPITIQSQSTNSRPYPGATPGSLAEMGASGLSEGAIDTLGAPGDLVTGAGNLVARGINKLTGSNLPMEESPIGSAAIKRGLSAIDPRLNPDYAQPQNEIERIVKGAGAGAGSAIVPVGAAGALGEKVAVAAEPFIGAATPSGVAANAAVGAVSGAGGQAASDAVPDQWKPLAGLAGGAAVPLAGIGAAGLVGAGGRAVADAVPPLTDAAKIAAARRQVGQEMSAAATDRGAALSNLATQPQEIIPGSQGTTAQIAGDPGLLAYEKGVAQTPEGKPAFDQRAAEQNNARQAAIGAIQPEGSVLDLPEAIRGQAGAVDTATQSDLNAARSSAAAQSAAVDSGTAANVAAAQAQHQTALGNLQALKPDASPVETAAYFRSMRDAMEQEGGSQIAAANQGADTARNATAPSAASLEQVGANLRAPAAEARATQSDAVQRLYDSLPQNMVAPTSDIAAKAQAIQGSMLPEHSPIVGEEARLMDIAGSYGDQMPLKNVNALRGSILSARSVLRNSDPQAYGRLGQLQGVVENAVDHSIENQAALDQIAVRRGTMAPSDAIPARIQRMRDAESAWQQATSKSVALAGDRGFAGGRPGRSAGGDAGGLRAPSETELGPGSVAGREGLSGAPGGIARSTGSGSAPAAQPAGGLGATPLREANAAYRDLKQTHDEGVVGDILAKGGRGTFDLSNAQVAAKVFHAKPTAAEDARAYLKSAGTEKGIPALSDAAAFSLHDTAVNPADGTFNTAKATKWIADHKAALDVLPSQVRTKFENARDAQQAVSDLMSRQRESLSDFDKSEAGRAAGLTNSGDIVKHVGSILDGGKAPEQRLAELARSAKGYAPAANGLKRAVIEHVLDKFVPEVGNPQTEKLQAYVAAKKDVLSKVLSPSEVEGLASKAEAATAAKNSVATAQDTRTQAMKDADATGRKNIASAEAARAEALSKYDRGVLGQLKGVNTTGDVLNVIKGIFGAKDGAAKMQALASEASKVPGATDALKRAVQEHIQREYTSTTESGATHVMELKRAGLADFMKTKTDALKAAGLSDEQIGLLRAVTEDGLRANRSISVTKARGGSDTVPNQLLAAKMAAAGKGSILGHLAIDVGLAGAGHMLAGIPGAVIGKYLGDKVVSSLREAGLAKVKNLRAEAIMNPDLGHALMKEFPVLPDRGTASLLGLRARQASIAASLTGARQGQSSP